MGLSFFFFFLIYFKCFEMVQIAVTELFQMGCAREIGIVESMIFSEESTAFARKLLHSPGNPPLLFLAKAESFLLAIKIGPINMAVTKIRLLI